jgi:hypothetical protein
MEQYPHFIYHFFKILIDEMIKRKKCPMKTKMPTAFWQSA